MKALVYHGPGKISWEEKPKPQLKDPSDVIIKISKTTVCGTDIAILKGGVTTCRPGRIIGHEATGYIVEAGSAVTNFKVGDHVIIPCTSSCGNCSSCRKGVFSSCRKGGRLIGNIIDGVQAEYARIPLADSSLHAIPQGLDEEAALLLADIIPTGLEVGAQKAKIELGDTVAVLGAGPVGLASVIAAGFFFPAQIIVVDRDDYRLEKAKELGATITINNKDGNAAQTIMQFTKGQGVDACIEAIGSPSTFQLAQEIIGSGGRIANVGVFTKSAEIHNELLWTKNISLHMGLVNTNTIPQLIKMILAGKLDPKCLISHRLPLKDIVKAYDIFQNAAHEKAIKIILSNEDGAITHSETDEEQLVRQIVAQVLATL